MAWGRERWPDSDTAAAIGRTDPWRTTTSPPGRVRRGTSGPGCWSDRARSVLYVIAAVCFVIAAAPQPVRAAGCDQWLGGTARLTGSYVPAKEAFARPFVLAMVLDCAGTKHVVTVQRPTGSLPVCKAGDEVEVVGKMVWNRTLVDGHYEINDPSSVTCRAAARAPTSGPERQEVAQTVQAGPRQATEPPRSRASAIEPSVWRGRYEDSRGAGDVTFTLVRGQSAVSGTWRPRTGGGGPVTGTLEAGGRRMQFRMENTAPECPGLFEGSAEITDTALVATYRGKDCEGDVTGGRLELHPQ